MKKQTLASVTAEKAVRKGPQIHSGSLKVRLP